MEIITFGTSHGSPEKGRFCTATLLRTNNVSYLIDCGAPVEALMKNREIPVNSIKSVFITHMHEDHVCTLSAIVKYFNFYQELKDPVQNVVDIHFPEENAIEAFNNWLLAIHSKMPSKYVNFKTVTPGEFYQDENIKVTAIPTDHIQGFPTYAYKMELEGKKILFTGDLAGDIHDYPQVAFEEDFDAIISEFTHFSIMKTLPMFKKMKTKQIIFTHVSPWNVESFPDVKDLVPFPAFLAEDGSSFEI